MTDISSIDNRSPIAGGRTPHCPSVLELEALVQAQAAAAAVSPAARHLEKCAYCRDRLKAISGFEAKTAKEPAKPAAGTQQCLPLLVLEGIADNPADFPKGSLALRHLNACSRCRGKVEMLRGFEARSPRKIRILHWERHWERRYAGSLALIAASLLVAVTLGWRLQQKPGNEPPPQEVYRSLQFQAISPAGNVASAPLEFRWESVSGAKEFRLHLFDVDRTEIWSVTTTASTTPVPDEVRRKMIPGRAFLWMVEARDSAGEKTGETNLRRLFIEIVKPPAAGGVE